MIALLGAALLGLPVGLALWRRGHRANALALAPLAALLAMVLPTAIALWWPPALSWTGALAAITAALLGGLGLLLPRTRPEPLHLQAMDGVIVAWLLVTALVGLALCRHAVFGWDGLSIWLNHAVVLSSGSSSPPVL